MLFNSLDFFSFFIITTAIFFVMPHRMKNIWLLLMSYLFYMGWNAKYALLIFIVTVTT